MDKREKNLNQLNGTENTATNMKVNTQEASRREPQPVQPVQPTQNFERQSEPSPQSGQPLQSAQPVSTTKRNPIRPLKDRQDAVAKEQRQQAKQIKESICRRIKALAQNTTVGEIQVYTGKEPPSNYAYQLKYQNEDGKLLPVEDDMRLYWLVKSQKHIYISHETKGQEVSQNTKGPEELYAHFYYNPSQNSSNSRNSNQIICNRYGRFKNSDALNEYLKSQSQTNSPAPQEQPVQPTQPAEPVQPTQPTQPTQNFERQPRQSPQSEQPLQPARKQNPIPASSQKSGITLDEETQITLDNALSNLIQDKSAKQHRIYFGKNNNQSFDYYSGNKDQERTFAPYGNSICLRNDEGKNVEDLQSYLNNGKTIYCYNPKQNEYIGHFKKTEKGINVSQSNTGPIQSQKQQRLKKNTGLQSTELTQVSPTQPLQPAQEQNPVSTSSQKSEDTLDKATQAMQQTTSPESKQQIEPQDPQEQPTPTTSMSTQQELIKTPLDSDETNVDNKEKLLGQLRRTNSLKPYCNGYRYEDFKEINFVNKGKQSYLCVGIEDGCQGEIRIIFDQNYRNINEAIQNVANYSSVIYAGLPIQGVICRDTYKKENDKLELSEVELALTQEKQEELNRHLKDTYDINLENTNYNVTFQTYKASETDPLVKFFHINFCNNGQNYTLSVNFNMCFDTDNAILYQVYENRDPQIVDPIRIRTSESLREPMVLGTSQTPIIRQTQPEIIPNTIPEQNMENKNSSSKTTDIASSDKGAKSTIAIHRNNKQSTPVQTNQGPLRPQRPPQRLQRPPQRPQRLQRPPRRLQQPQGPQVVQAEIMPNVPPVQNLNEPVDNVRFDTVEVPESNTDIIKQDALLMSLNTITPPPQLSTDSVLSDIAEPKKEIQYNIERTNELKRGRFSSSSSYDSYDSYSSGSIGPGSPITGSTSIERKNSLGAISTQESETMSHETFIESPKEVSTSPKTTENYEKKLNDMIPHNENSIQKSKHGTYHVISPQGKTKALYGYVKNKDNTISFFKITDAELFFKKGYYKNGIVLKETNGFTRTKEMKKTDIVTHVQNKYHSEIGSVESIFSGYETAKLIPQPGTEKTGKSTMAEIKPVDGSVNAYATNAELTPTSPQDEQETRRGCFNFFKRRNRGGRS